MLFCEMWAPNNYNILCKVLESEREDSAVFGEKKTKRDIFGNSA